MSDARCPACSAHVAPAARWCGQCYATLVTEPVKPPRPPLHGGLALAVQLPPAPPAPPTPPGTVPPPPAPPEAAPGKVVLGRQPWPCVRCETVNKFEDSTCSACGLGFLDALAEPPTEVPLIGKIDGSTFSGKLKIGLIGFVSLVVLLLVVATIAGLVLR